MADTDILIREELLERIERKKEILDSKRPLPRDALRNLEAELRLQHTYNSNAIEGNTLTLSETKLVLEQGITVGGKSLKEHLEAQNTAKAYDLVGELARGKREIDHETIQEIHEVLTKGIIEDSGRYRTKNVRITGSDKIPPDFSKVVDLMNDLIEDVRYGKGHPIETVAGLHHRLVEIHPFSDGNGRTARLLTNLHLIDHGYPPIVLRNEERTKYYRFLRAADRGSLEPLVNFIAKAVDESLSHYLSIFGGDNQLMPLKELAKASPYSQEYLSLRARQEKLDAVKIGKVWYSSRRALEEYLDRLEKG